MSSTFLRQSFSPPIKKPCQNRVCQLVRQCCLPFQTPDVSQKLLPFELGALSQNGPGRGFGIKGVEFFFAGRNRRWCVRPSEY